MRVFRLTSIGLSLASNPTTNMSDEKRVLYWMRRKGGSATDEQTKDFLGGDGMKARLVLNNLMRGDAPAVVEVASR